MSSYIDSLAAGIVAQQPATPAPPTPDFGNMSALILNQSEPGAFNQYLTDTGRFNAPFRGPDGTLMHHDSKKYWSEISKQRMKEFTLAAGKEAVLAETNLLPGMALLAGEAAMSASEWLPGGVKGPMHVLQSILASREKATEEPLTAGGTEDLPRSFKVMMPYFKAYDNMVDVESDLVVALANTYGDPGLGGPAMSAALMHTGANVAVGMANPAGKVAKVAAKTIGVGVRGTIWGASALLGSKVFKKLASTALKGDKFAASKLGKTLGLLGGVGRGAHPAVDATAAIEAIAKAESDRIARTLGTTSLNPLDEVIERMRLDVTASERKRMQGNAVKRNLRSMARRGQPLPPAHIFDKKPVDTWALDYLTPEQNILVRQASERDRVAKRQLGPLYATVPFASTNLYDTLRAIAKQGTEELPTVLKAKQTAASVRELAEKVRGTGQTAKEFLDAADELDRLATQVVKQREPRGFWSRIAHVTNPVWRLTGHADESHKVASHYVHYREQALADAGVNYQRMLDDIPDKATREDMIAFIEETGNPWRGADDNYKLVQERINGSEYGARATEWKKHIRARFDSYFEEMEELNSMIGDDAVSYVDNWLHHMWEEPVAEAKSKINRLRRKQLPATGSMEKHRYFATYYNGMIDGKLTPRTNDIATLYALTEQQYARVMATKKLIRELQEIGVDNNGLPAFARIPHSAPVPDGYSTFRSAFTDRMATGDLPAPVLKNSKVVAHNSVLKHIRNILEQPQDVKGITRISSVVKRSNFMFTLFHMYSLAESGVALNGPLRGARVNASIMRNSVFTRGGQWADGESLSHLVTTDSFKEAWTNASYHGVRLGAPMADVMKDQFSEVLNQAVRGLKAKTGINARQASDTLEGFQGWFDKTLWSKYHTPMKVVSFDMMFDNLKRVRNGEKGLFVPPHLRKGLKEMDDETLGREVARFINDEFGGQNWETATRGWVENWLSKPDTLKAMNALFTSVDWNTSAIKAGLAFSQSVPGLKNYNPARAILGLRHWRNAIVGYAFYANMVNKALSGQWIWENEAGKKVFHVNLGEKDEKGKVLYAHVGKQFRELPGSMGVNIDLSQRHTPKVHVNWEAVGPAMFVARKTMPWVQAPFRMLESYPDEVSKYLREGKEMGLDDEVLFGIRQLMTPVAPFSLGQSINNPALSDVPYGTKAGLMTRAVGTALPISRSPSDSLVVSMMARALRENDTDRFHNLYMDIGSNRGVAKAHDLVNKAYEKVSQFPTGEELEVEVEGSRQWVRDKASLFE